MFGRRCSNTTFFHFHSSLFKHQSFDLDIPATLMKLLKDPDQFCRLKAAECYFVMAGKVLLNDSIIKV